MTLRLCKETLSLCIVTLSLCIVTLSLCIVTLSPCIVTLSPCMVILSPASKAHQQYTGRAASCCSSERRCVSSSQVKPWPKIRWRLGWSFLARSCLFAVIYSIGVWRDVAKDVTITEEKKVERRGGCNPPFHVLIGTLGFRS